jgi:hypothetical protein
MDDRRYLSAPSSLASQDALLVPLKRCVACLAIASAIWTIGGCSLGVMAGKLLFGDPTQTAPFRTVTEVDLAKGDKSVLIVASTPQAAKQAQPGLDLLIAERVSRTLRGKGVKVYPSKKVLNWVDNRGGQWGSPDEVASAFPDANYIVEIDVDQFDHLEESSPDLYRGRSMGNVRAYEVVEVGGRRSASPVFSREFNCTYPSMVPKQAHQISERTFKEEFTNRVCGEVARLFYDHKANETVY